jgi:hypothetical protein
MPVHHLAAVSCSGHLVQAAGLTVNGPGEVHQLPQAQGLRPGQGDRNVLSIQRRAGRLQVRGGNAGRRHQEHVDGQGRRFVQEVANRLEPAHIRQLVQVGDDAGGAAREDGTGVLGEAQEGAFDVGVAVDEAGQEIGAVKGHGLGGPVAGADAGDDTLGDDHVALFHLTTENVDDATLGQQKIARGLPPCHGYHPLSVHGYPSSSIQMSGK